VAKLIHVAVGVIVGSDGKILIAKRPQTAHQGGLWEFPGGKVDAGESVQQALCRELKEELAISVIASEPLIQIRHHYPDKSVLLDVYKVTHFEGQPCGAEGQPICWVSVDELGNYEFPAANKPIIKALELGDKYLITGEFVDEDDFCQRLSGALEQGIRFVQLRVNKLDLIAHKHLLGKAVSLTEKFSATLLINSSVDLFEEVIELFPSANIALHLNSHNAAAISVRPIATRFILGVSCHNEQEIAHAQQIGADYLLLSPVKKTSSHPEAVPLEWSNFKALVELANLPVYALGGVGQNDIVQAKSVGAQGVAGISAWW
jgi:8-oxo-dGTP diphosphatase